MKIGVFDSGVGGQSVASEIAKALPYLEIMLCEDHAHVPYGTKPLAEILGYVKPIFAEMVNAGCQVIVVACNTVTTNLIKDLRAEFSVPMVAIEPMVKPAAELTKSKIIAVCATPATLKSRRYHELRQTYAAGISIIEPDCSQWATMIETDHIDHQIIRTQIDDAIAQGADVIVLGCTHYHWIEAEVRQIAAGRAEVLQPTEAIIRRLKTVISEIEQLA